MFKEITIQDYQSNIFHKIGKEWMLIGAEANDRCNAMTASWGGMGILWNKPVVFVFIRPQRFTNSLVGEASHFSLSFYPEHMREMLTYMGTVSGKDEDKITKAGLHVVQDHAPYFAEASEVMICRKLFAQELDPECILDASIDKQNYPLKDYHILYVGEIEKILVKE